MFKKKFATRKPIDFNGIVIGSSQHLPPSLVDEPNSITTSSFDSDAASWLNDSQDSPQGSSSSVRLASSATSNKPSAEVAALRRRSVDSLSSVGDGGRSTAQPLLQQQQQQQPQQQKQLQQQASATPTRSARESTVASDVQAALLGRNQSRMAVKDDDLQDALDFFANSAGGFPTRARQSSSAGLNAELTRNRSRSQSGDITMLIERARQASIAGPDSGAGGGVRASPFASSRRESHADMSTSPFARRGMDYSPSTPSRARAQTGYNSFPSPELRRDSSSWSSFSDVAETVEMMHLPPEICDRSFTMNRQYFLDFILKDRDGRLVFMNFLKQRHCAENLMFWVDVERYSLIEDYDMAKRKVAAKAIYQKFISTNSDYEINVNGALKKEIDANMAEPTRDLFLQAQKAIFLLMVYGSFDYFLNSELEFHQQKKKDGTGSGEEDQSEKKSPKKKGSLRRKASRRNLRSTGAEDKKCLVS